MVNHPLLPPDLEREIFETTVRMHPQTTTILLRVARRVLIWTEPRLYKVIRTDSVAVKTNRSGGAALALLNKSPDFCRRAVRHLALLSFPGPPEAPRTLLELCSGVTDLAFGGGFHPDASFVPILAEMRLQRLAVCIADLGCDLTHPLFASITHLVIFDNSEKHLRSLAAQIPTLSALTHLAVFFDKPRNIILPVLPACPVLELFLVLYSDVEYGYLKKHPSHIGPCRDHRLLIGAYNSQNFWANWEASAKGLQDDHYALADALLTRKRRGEIDEGHCWLE
ncbi:hypothetical protein C8R46DRAFT_1235621 [Mycena filopes]|nr:hypothetical protein C8R46DRAFT_1235621 [Mycena filopes]